MKRSDLYEYQNFSVDFLKEHPEALLILEMGLGKSAISLTAILDLMFDRFEVGKTLVIAPLRVARTVWPEERETWEQRCGRKNVRPGSTLPSCGCPSWLVTRSSVPLPCRHRRMCT